MRNPGMRCRLADDRGVATIEGVLVFAMLAGVLLGLMFLGQWGTHLQYSQMGARLLAFNAADTNLAKLGRQGNEARQTSTHGDSWYTYFNTMSTAGWLNTLFVLPNESYSGFVRGTQRGRLPSQGRSMFDFSSGSMGYYSGSSAAYNSWTGNDTNVTAMFLGIAWHVGRYQQTPEALESVPHIPHSIPVLETIYSRVGVR